MNDLDDIGDSPESLGSPIPEDTFSAGEVGEAVDGDGAARDAGLAEVIVGEIPDVHNLSHMLWTARCTVPAHGLLGTFERQEEAENAKRAHLLRQHGHDQWH
ncbi:MAG: hypothetical protein ABSH29_14485 [Acidimicrobiales bacterium]|jgi:hypothetical protein